MATVQFDFATAHKANGIARPEFARCGDVGLNVVAGKKLRASS
jgi:hypothetical protein